MQYASLKSAIVSIPAQHHSTQKSQSPESQCTLFKCINYEVGCHEWHREDTTQPNIDSSSIYYELVRNQYTEDLSKPTNHPETITNG